MLKKNQIGIAAWSILIPLILPLAALADEAKPAAQAMSREDQAVLDDGEVGVPQYLIGGVVGTVLGLGTGEAIQGRYYKTGWIVTLGELGSLGVAIAGANSSNCSSSSLASGATTISCSNSALTTVGVIGYVGFRVFELIDIWAGPPTQNARYRKVQERHPEQKVSFLLSPTSAQSAVAGVQFRF